MQRRFCCSHAAVAKSGRAAAENSAKNCAEPLHSGGGGPQTAHQGAARAGVQGLNEPTVRGAVKDRVTEFLLLTLFGRYAVLVEVLQQCKHVHKLVCGASEAHASAPAAAQISDGEVQSTASSSSSSAKKVAEAAMADSLSVLEKVMCDVDCQVHSSVIRIQVAEAAHDKCADILGLRSQSTCKLPLLQFTCLFDDCVKFVGTTDRLADKQVQISNAFGFKP